MKQTYKNHIRYYAPHHFILLPLLIIMTVVGVVKAIGGPTHQLAWTLFALLSFCILYLAVMVRQHYALGNQDRIVRLEFRLRYFEIFGQSAQEVEKKLRFGQIAALRFADDAIFKALLKKALEEGLSSQAIKKSIPDWQPDYMRV